MGWVNNGTARSLKITVDKTVGGNQVLPERIYNGQLSGTVWGNPSYAALTDDEMRQLSSADFLLRYNDFVAYVESVEAGLDFTTDIVGDGATKYDAALCLATTTTTVYVPPPVYAFSIKYGEYPVDACAGTLSVVYSSVQVPGVGDFLYKDLALTQPWDTVAGSYMLFVSPVIYTDEVVNVAIVDTAVYDLGEIMLLTGFHCNGVTPVTTTTTTAAVVPLSVYWEYTNGSESDIGGDSPSKTDYWNMVTSRPLVGTEAIGMILYYELDNAAIATDGVSMTSIAISNGVSTGNILGSGNVLNDSVITTAGDTSNKTGVTGLQLNASNTVIRLGISASIHGDSGTSGTNFGKVTKISVNGINVTISSFTSPTDATVSIESNP